MLKELIRWLLAIQQNNAQRKFEAGFTYAAGKLLMHGADVKHELENEVRQHTEWSCRNEYDDGVKEAIHNYEALAFPAVVRSNRPAAQFFRK